MFILSGFLGNTMQEAVNPKMEGCRRTLIPNPAGLKRRRGLTAALAIPRADVAGPSRFIVQDLKV